MQYLRGRVDCESVENPPADDDLPNSNTTNAVSYLRRQFPTLDTSEAVALMGMLFHA